VTDTSFAIAADAPPALADFVAAVERIHAEHRVAYHAAGDDQIYAYGGRGYLVILSQRGFGGLVELQTPEGTARIEPNEAGEVHVAAVSGDNEAGAMLADAAVMLQLYYRRRADVWKVKI
jgi:hypothetical protein